VRLASGSHPAKPNAHVKQCPWPRHWHIGHQQHETRDNGRQKPTPYHKRPETHTHTHTLVECWHDAFPVTPCISCSPPYCLQAISESLNNRTSRQLRRCANDNANSKHPILISDHNTQPVMVHSVQLSSWHHTEVHPLVIIAGCGGRQAQSTSLHSAAYKRWAGPTICRHYTKTRDVLTTWTAIINQRQITQLWLQTVSDAWGTAIDNGRQVACTWTHGRRLTFRLQLTVQLSIGWFNTEQQIGLLDCMLKLYSEFYYAPPPRTGWGYWDIMQWSPLSVCLSVRLSVPCLILSRERKGTASSKLEGE